MKKNLLWMLAVILSCGEFFTSCSDDGDNSPVIPTRTDKLMGEWFASVNLIDYDEDSDEDEVEYILFTLDEEGVVTQDIYIGNTNSPVKYWERMHRHGIYTIDKATRTITFENISSEPTSIQYIINKDQLTFNIFGEDSEHYMALPLHRPSKAEKDLLAVYNNSLPGFEYTGKWFSAKEENGQHTYVMLDFTEESRLKTISYSVNGDECIRNEYIQYYSDYDEDEDEEEQILEIHHPNDYSQSDYYWWEVVGNTLTLGTEEDEDEVISTYHALTKADIELMAELEKKSTTGVK